jgi:hypothetical protein
MLALPPVAVNCRLSGASHFAVRNRQGVERGGVRVTGSCHFYSLIEAIRVCWGNSKQGHDFASQNEWRSYCNALSLELSGTMLDTISEGLLRK